MAFKATRGPKEMLRASSGRFLALDRKSAASSRCSLEGTSGGGALNRLDLGTAGISSAKQTPSPENDSNRGQGESQIYSNKSLSYA